MILFDFHFFHHFDHFLTAEKVIFRFSICWFSSKFKLLLIINFEATLSQQIEKRKIYFFVINIPSALTLTLTSVFFFPVKIKSARESHFWPFFDFFHGRQHPFHAHFFHFFHAHFLVFTDTFGHFFAFSRALFYFHAHFFFSFFFTGAFFPFHGHFLCFFSRKENQFSRGKKKTLIQRLTN